MLLGTVEILSLKNFSSVSFHDLRSGFLVDLWGGWSCINEYKGKVPPNVIRVKPEGIKTVAIGLKCDARQLSR